MNVFLDVKSNEQLAAMGLQIKSGEFCTHFERTEFLLRVTKGKSTWFQAAETVRIVVDDGSEFHAYCRQLVASTHLDFVSYLGTKLVKRDYQYTSSGKTLGDALIKCLTKAGYIPI